MAKSPSITLIERDLSTYAVTGSNTVVALIGYATKGPINEATMCTSKSEFVKKFGSIPDIPFSHLAAYHAFNQGNQVIYKRIADTVTAGSRAEEANRVLFSTTHIVGSTYLDLTVTGNTSTVEDNYLLGTAGGYAFKMAINGMSLNSGNDITITLAMAITETMGVLQTNFTNVLASHLSAAGLAGNLSITATNLTGTTSRIIFNSITTGYNSGVVLYSPTGTLTSFPGISSQVVVRGVGYTKTTAITSKEKGSELNKLSVMVDTRLNPVTYNEINRVTVYFNDVLQETFDDVSWNTTATNFYGTIVNADLDNNGSKYITISTYGTGYAPLYNGNTDNSFGDGVEYLLGVSNGLVTETAASLTLTSVGSYTYKSGTDGIPTVTTSRAGLFVTALDPDGDLGNVDLFDQHILATPDCNEAAVQNAALTLAESRGDFIYLIDPPVGKNYTEIIDWHNGKGSGRNAALNSSYGATYWPWLKDYNTKTAQYVWCPPSVWMIEKYLEIDKKYAPWYAPAGDAKGKIIASDIETSPSFAQREQLYGDFNCVNPIVNFNAKGLIIYGQKTALRENKALNRIHVRRLVIYLKKLMKKAMEAFPWEFHVPETWARATSMLNAILEPVRAGQGLEAYNVVIDSTLNTPDIVAQSIMKCVVKIIPINVIEIIEITLEINKTGVKLG